MLEEAVFEAEWPTPTATDAKGAGSALYSTESGRHSGTTLTDAVVRLEWPTPTASDYGSNQGGAAGRSGPARPSLSATARGPLNPAWIEALMGFPPGWTDVGPPAEDSHNTSGSRPEPSQPARSRTARRAAKP